MEAAIIESNTSSGPSTQLGKLKMAKAASCKSRVITYLPSLRALLQRLRGAGPATPTTLSFVSQPPHTFTAGHTSPHKMTSPAVMSTMSSVFQPNPTLPLPGDVALAPDADQPAVLSIVLSQSLMPDSVAKPSIVARHPVAEFATAVECSIQECPAFLQRSFMELFPDAPILEDSPFTVMTLSQHTQNDMTAWSPAVEKEREELLKHFIEGAKCVCGKLTASGYWADFVDPSCGRAFYGRYTNSTLFETDDRFRYFGLEILDLGCCKCISHHLWGRHAYVGAIFTNAPADAPVLKELARTE